MNAPVLYYISAHGYGHGARSCDIIRAFNRRYPDVPVIITTDLPLDFLRSRLTSRLISFRRGAFDVGMVQLDSIRVDIPATLSRLRELYENRDQLVQKERGFLRQSRASVVVVDIPALPLAAAALEGVPALAAGNFGWDWIYAEFIPHAAEWEALVDQISEDYRQAGLLLRMPFSEPMAAFPRQQDIPLVASPGRPRRDELAARFRCDPAKTWALLSFTSLAWDAAALDRIARLKELEFFTVRPLAWERQNIHAVDRHDIPFADVIASVDVVVTKPGFGILSECVVNRKPIVYTERVDFREYAVLEASIKKYLKHQHLPGEQLYRGELEAALAAVAKCPEPTEFLEAGGDLIAADWIAKFRI